MKWRREVEIDDIELTPWLVIQYKVENYAAERADYLLWIGDSNREHHDGVHLIKGKTIRANDQWHTQAFNLADLRVIPPITQMALQCFATDIGKASLWVDFITVTDTLPADAEGVETPTGTGRSVPVAMPETSAWTTQPSWLANYTTNNACERTVTGTRFSVKDAGMGAKWSYNLPQAIRNVRWIAMKYRATGIQSYNDYALYIRGESEDKKSKEQNIIRLADIVSDNSWHVQISPVEIPSINTLAVQLQAIQPDANLEIASITFEERKPIIRLPEIFECQAGWSAGTGIFRPVDLPQGNTDGLQLSRKLGFEGWIAEGKITANGISFNVRAGTDAAIITPGKAQGNIDIPLSGKAAELYLLLAARLPSHEEQSFSGNALHGIRQVERFVARIEYTDNTSEEQFPFLLSKGNHIITRGLNVYSLALDPQKSLKRVTFIDGMTTGAFGLVAATLCDKPGPASLATTPKPAISPLKPQKVETHPASISQSEKIVKICSATLGLTLDCSNGLRVTSAENFSYAKAPLNLKSGPLFRIKTGDLNLTSEDFQVAQIRDESSADNPQWCIDCIYKKAVPQIRVSVFVDVKDNKEIGLRATCDIGGQDPKTSHFFFPELTGLYFSNKHEDTWYWMPRRGDVISNVPIALREPYAGGGAPLQIIGTFDPAQGTGMYLMTQDMNAMPRYYQLQKTEAGVRMAMEYNPYSGIETPHTVIGCNQGDWHEQLQRYREWVATWYKPAAPLKSWFREIFNFRQQFIHFTVPTKSGMFDEKTKTLRIKEVVNEDARDFGGVDYLHLFDWGWDPVHGRCGDYVPWDYLGGADKFKAEVEKIKKSGVPVGLYIEGYLVDPQSDLGKAKGKAWQLLDSQGKPYNYFDPSYNICAWVKDWQDYLSATYARAKQQTGAVGFYIDEYGFSTPGHCCYNPDHGHPVPVTPVLGEREMLRRVREAVGPECALYTEESPTDVNSQYQDGSFTYHISSVKDDWSPTHINLYRFAFPTFKTIEIITCDHPLGSNIEACKRILFNGEAIWIEGIAGKWFTAETRAYIAKMHKVLRDNKQCFTSNCPQPLVPTLTQGLYANMFPGQSNSHGKTCWTIYNTGFRTVRGEIIRVQHLRGAKYRDEFTGHKIQAKVTGDEAVLTFEIGPRDVAVISRTCK
ncbi:MAG: DUF6259 domain-containing protein [Kiritimatiellae bacterium]|nr:DUF6259 domain-containing protein [Kiritimatiellia bacterium]